MRQRTPGCQQVLQYQEEAIWPRGKQQCARVKERWAPELQELRLSLGYDPFSCKNSNKLFTEHFLCARHPYNCFPGRISSNSYHNEVGTIIIPVNG